MKELMKIAVAVSMLFLLIGIVSAADVDNMEMPSGWEAVGDGCYHQELSSGNGRDMMIQKWYDGLKDEYYYNLTDEGYSVVDKGNNTFRFTDAANSNAGSFEVVEIDGEKYFVKFWAVDDVGAVETSLAEAVALYDFMIKFNKLNNLEPVAV